MNRATSELANPLRLYRDCLRLVRHIGVDSPKGRAMKVMVRSEFKKNKTLTNPKLVEEAKSAAVRGLSNYLLFQSKKLFDDRRAAGDAAAAKDGHVS